MQTLIGIMIKRAREEQSMTQTQLGEKSGITQGEISRIESGKNQPTAEQVDTIANILKAPELLFTACSECRITKSIQNLYDLPTEDEQYLQLLSNELQAVNSELETWMKQSSKNAPKTRFKQLAGFKNRLARHVLIVRAISHLLGQPGLKSDKKV